MIPSKETAISASGGSFNIDPKKTYVPIATVVGIFGVIAASVWWASSVQTKLDYTAEAVQPIPQMQQDLAAIKQAVSQPIVRNR